MNTTESPMPGASSWRCSSGPRDVFHKRLTQNNYGSQPDMEDKYGG